jgi:hypothetical protein
MLANCSATMTGNIVERVEMEASRAKRHHISSVMPTAVSTGNPNLYNTKMSFTFQFFFFRFGIISIIYLTYPLCLLKKLPIRVHKYASADQSSKEFYRMSQWFIISELIPSCCEEVIGANTTKQTPWPLVRKWTIPNVRPPLVDEI